MSDTIEILKEHRIASFFIVVGILGYVGAVLCGIIELTIICYEAF